MRRPDVDVDRVHYPVIVGRSWSTPGAGRTDRDLRKRVHTAVAEYLSLTGEDGEAADRAATLAAAAVRPGTTVVTFTREQLAYFAARATEEPS